VNIVSVGLFGMLGACLRYGIGLAAVGWLTSPFPWGTLMINLLGSLLLGWFTAWIALRHAFPTWLRVGFGTGFVGAFTTFSTFSMETLLLMQQNRIGLAGCYVMISILGGLACAALGFVLGDNSRRTQGEETI